jgi:limonene-1,2-epoxide hydrolase
MVSNSDVVRRFCAAFERLDADELTAYFTPDALYHNIPMAPLRGHAAIHAFIKAIPEQFLGLRFEILHQVAGGNLVMNERLDHFELRDRVVTLPVAGIFELEQGKIRAWRDYFDLATLAHASA